MAKRLTISLVIPVYNEESHLADCLRSVVAQRRPFDEIIVVDNNSTDATRQIAGLFPGVNVLAAARQGVVYARNAGFDAAAGDIIARIDADSRLPADWTEQLEHVFQDTQQVAVTGQVSYYGISLAPLLSGCDRILRRTIAYLLGPNMALQGANMALRRSVWQALRTQTCNQSGMHEDFDLAIHIAQAGHQVQYQPSLQAAVAFRQAASSWTTFASYYWHCPKTYFQHYVGRGRRLVPVVLVIIAAYPILHLLAKSYDESKQRFSLSLLFDDRASVRVNPATFVD